MNQFSTRSPAADWSAEAFDSVERFEKFRRREDGRMPTRAHQAAVAGSRKTPGSRRASRRVAKLVGGCHQRRHRAVLC